MSRNPYYKLDNIINDEDEINSKKDNNPKNSNIQKMSKNKVILGYNNPIKIYIEDIIELTSGTKKFQKAVLISLCYAFFLVGFLQLSFKIFYLEPEYLCFDNHNSKLKNHLNILI
jgi:hypothetical protein